MLSRILRKGRSIARQFLSRGSDFDRFQGAIHRKTKELDRKICAEAVSASADEVPPDSGQPSGSEIEQVGRQLRSRVLQNFAGCLAGVSSIRVAVHVPAKNVSPAGFSLFSNLAESLAFIGIPTVVLPWEGTQLPSLLETFRPNILLSSDAADYLSRIDWNTVQRFRQENKLVLGLTASLEEYGNSPLEPRLDWAKEKGVGFYYSFRTQRYLRDRKEYAPFFQRGYHICTVEFGANPLLYYPVTSRRDLDFVFLASSNPDKWPRYYDYLAVLLRKYPGFVNGPGWSWVRESLKAEHHRFVYARAKVGLNLHLQESVDWANELNERTYILAACGVPQLIDHPRLLEERFSSGAFYVADSPRQYRELFRHAMNSPEESERRALSALQEVYAKHTTFHRAKTFAEELQVLLGQTD